MTPFIFRNCEPGAGRCWFSGNASSRTRNAGYSEFSDSFRQTPRLALRRVSANRFSPALLNRQRLGPVQPLLALTREPQPFYRRNRRDLPPPQHKGPRQRFLCRAAHSVRLSLRFRATLTSVTPHPPFSLAFHPYAAYPEHWERIACAIHFSFAATFRSAHPQKN